jgi:hypothetical protein
MLREIQGRKEISTIFYNKSKYITRGLLPDSKAKKKIPI